MARVNRKKRRRARKPIQVALYHARRARKQRIAAAA